MTSMAVRMSGREFGGGQPCLACVLAAVRLRRPARAVQPKALACPALRRPGDWAQLPGPRVPCRFR